MDEFRPRMVLDAPKSALACIVSTILIYHIVAKLWNRRRTSPPGLPRIPVLGSLPWLPRDVNHRTFTHLAKIYGNIYSIDFGPVRAIVLNDLTIIKEAFLKTEQATVFAGRPTDPVGLSLNPKSKGIVEAQCEEAFLRNKRILLAGVRELQNTKSISEGNIIFEVSNLLDVFSSKSSQAFNPAEHIQVSIANIICSLLFNKRFALNDQRFIQHLTNLRSFGCLFWESSKIRFIPFAHHLPFAKRIVRSLTECNLKLENFIYEELQDHAKRAIQCGEEGGAPDLVTAYRNKKGDLCDEEMLMYITRDIFAAGADTTSAALIWAILYMANNQSIQARVHQEIGEFIGEDRHPTLSDRDSLQYVQATIFETLRMASTAPLAIPHATMEDADIMGYKIKKGTMVFINLWGVQHDPNLWKDPDTFDPERFLDGNGKVTGAEKFIPFGIGRRSCLGESVARQELFLFFTSILQKFTVLPPSGHGNIPEESIFGLVVHPEPFNVILKPRV